MSTVLLPDGDSADRPAGSTELRYSICPTLAGVLRTYLLAGGETSWRDQWATYAASDPSSRPQLITDINTLLNDAAASEEQVRLWVRVHTGSSTGLLEPGVPVRHSLLAVRDAAWADVRHPGGSSGRRGHAV